MRIKVTIIIIIITTLTSFSETMVKRSRGEGFYKCENANVIGAGNIWIEGTLLGFIWDSDEENNAPGKYIFPELKAEIGILDRASIYLQSRALSYGWKFGNISAGTKFTFLDNKNIKLHTPGILLEFNYNYLPVFHSSIAGYHDSKGTGFTPEGFTVHGAGLTINALYDLDFLAINSRVPIKLTTNFGAKLHLDKEYIHYSQYLFNFGVAYSGALADFFVEYSLEAFFNKSTEPKKFDMSWSNWHKVWEVAFWENPMYVTFGGRIRYPNGIVLYGAVPLLLSHNIGSDMTCKNPNELKKNFPDEVARGITDPFDPWYTNWKIVAKISYPIKYKGTSSELKRVFLLKKNRKEKKKIDIDKQLNENEQNDDSAKRLQEIKKKQLEIESAEE